jgi:hypothetical protein
MILLTLVTGTFLTSPQCLGSEKHWCNDGLYLPPIKPLLPPAFNCGTAPVERFLADTGTAIVTLTESE